MLSGGYVWRNVVNSTARLLSIRVIASILAYDAKETITLIVSFAFTRLTHGFHEWNPGELYGYLLREQVGRGETKRFLRNLNGRSKPLERA